MSLRNLLAAGADEVFRGYLMHQYIIDPVTRQQVRLRPGGYDRAIEQTLSAMHGLSRYDPRIFREQIAPRVRADLNAARRLNAGMPVSRRELPWMPGDRQQPPGVIQYTVRGRVTDRDGLGRSDFLVVVSSATPLTQSQVESRALTQAQLGRVTEDYRGRIPQVDSSSLVEWSTLSAYRVSIIG